MLKKNWGDAFVAVSICSGLYSLWSPDQHLQKLSLFRCHLSCICFRFLLMVSRRYTHSVCQQMVRAVWPPQGKWAAAALETAGRSRDRSSRACSHFLLCSSSCDTHTARSLGQASSLVMMGEKHHLCLDDVQAHIVWCWFLSMGKCLRNFSLLFRHAADVLLKSRSWASVHPQVVREDHKPQSQAGFHLLWLNPSYPPLTFIQTGCHKWARCTGTSVCVLLWI